MTQIKQNIHAQTFVTLRAADAAYMEIQSGSMEILPDTFELCVVFLTTYLRKNVSTDISIFGRNDPDYYLNQQREMKKEAHKRWKEG